MSDERPQESVRVLIERIDARTAATAARVQNIEIALFQGNGSPPVLSRLATLEERTTQVETTASRVERAGPRAGVWSGLALGAGTFFGAALIAVLGALGIKPPGGQQ